MIANIDLQGIALIKHVARSVKKDLEIAKRNGNYNDFIESRLRKCVICKIPSYKNGLCTACYNEVHKDFCVICKKRKSIKNKRYCSRCKDNIRKKAKRRFKDKELIDHFIEVELDKRCFEGGENEECQDSSISQYKSG